MRSHESAAKEIKIHCYVHSWRSRIYLRATARCWVVNLSTRCFKTVAWLHARRLLRLHVLSLMYCTVLYVHMPQ